ncbi:MAG: histidine phosphatase family protein [Planctomycetota bacterium]|jgi:broad specificity phosphatase PhoE
MPRFVFLRHAKSGTPGIYYGQRDVPLQNEGVEQEKNVLDVLKGKSFSAIISSPLSRCKNLAEKISELTRSELIIISELIEIDIGDWEGRTFEEASNVYQEIARELLSMKPTLEFPNGESLAGFRERASAAWHTLADKFKDAEEDILIVAHAGIIRALISHIRNLSSEKFWDNSITNCSATVIDYQYNKSTITNVGDDLAMVLSEI